MIGKSAMEKYVGSYWVLLTLLNKEICLTLNNVVNFDKLMSLDVVLVISASEPCFAVTDLVILCKVPNYLELPFPSVKGDCICHW
jgi:hypothetical protein